LRRRRRHGHTVRRVEGRQKADAVGAPSCRAAAAAAAGKRRHHARRQRHRADDVVFNIRDDKAAICRGGARRVLEQSGTAHAVDVAGGIAASAAAAC
jgi:hypothetical protein